CDCSTATEKSVTLTDPDTLWVLDTKGCNIYTVSFSGLNSPNSFDYVRVRETYSVSGTQTTCVKDAGNFQCSNHLCGAGVSILSGTSYSNTLPDGNANGIPDCREPGADADGDGVPNSSDNCPVRANADQSDRDSDGVGDVCDNCSSTPNADQAPAGGTHYSIGAACVNNPTPPTALICDCANQQYLKNSSFTLSGACSSHTDPNRLIVKYEWDFNYDATSGFTAAPTLGKTVTDPRYPSDGTYPVALRVTDDNAVAPQSDVYVCNVQITPSPICPHPDAGGGSGHAYTGLATVPVHFDASASFDPDNDPITFNWSLSG